MSTQLSRFLQATWLQPQCWLKLWSPCGLAGQGPLGADPRGCWGRQGWAGLSEAAVAPTQEPHRGLRAWSCPPPPGDGCAWKKGHWGGSIIFQLNTTGDLPPLLLCRLTNTSESLNLACTKEWGIHKGKKTIRGSLYRLPTNHLQARLSWGLLVFCSLEIVHIPQNQF